VPPRDAAQVGVWVVGADLLHDLVLAPVVGLVGFALARAAPREWRWPIRAGAIGSALMLLIAYPALRGFGRRTAPGNGSVLPLDYTSAVLTVLAALWGVVVIWGLVNTTIRARPMGGARRRPARAARR
jgi:hypothetical protein